MRAIVVAIIVLLCFVTAFICARIVDDAVRREASDLCFGKVEIRAYTPWQPSDGDMRTATNHLVQPDDYSVAVSKDVEAWMKGLDRGHKAMFIPDYNSAGEVSWVNDRSDLPSASVEVCFTVPDSLGALRRARAWGVKQGILYGQQTKAGFITWIEMEKKQ